MLTPQSNWKLFHIPTATAVDFILYLALLYINRLIATHTLMLIGTQPPPLGYQERNCLSEIIWGPLVIIKYVSAINDSPLFPPSHAGCKWNLRTCLFQDDVFTKPVQQNQYFMCDCVCGCCNITWHVCQCYVTLHVRWLHMAIQKSKDSIINSWEYVIVVSKAKVQNTNVHQLVTISYYHYYSRNICKLKFSWLNNNPQKFLLTTIWGSWAHFCLVTWDSATQQRIDQPRKMIKQTTPNILVHDAWSSFAFRASECEWILGVSSSLWHCSSSQTASHTLQ